MLQEVRSLRPFASVPRRTKFIHYLPGRSGLNQGHLLLDWILSEQRLLIITRNQIVTRNLITHGSRAFIILATFSKAFCLKINRLALSSV